jgi:hypothetical protein
MLLGTDVRRRFAFLVLPLLVALAASAPVSAVSSATFTFGPPDATDDADGPNYSITGIAPIDDGTACDAVVMIMVDATGQVTDADDLCLPIPAGTAVDDMDAGSFGTAYIPTLGPITFTLFDLTAADLAALSAFSINDQEYVDYVLANARCLSEQFLAASTIPDLSTIPAGTPFSQCVTQATTAPTLGTAALVMLVALLAGASLFVLRRNA